MSFIDFLLIIYVCLASIGIVEINMSDKKRQEFGITCLFISALGMCGTGLIILIINLMKILC